MPRWGIYHDKSGETDIWGKLDKPGQIGQNGHVGFFVVY